MSIVWSVLVAAVTYLIFHDRRSAAVMGLVVVSHWLLDFIVHPPELPLLFNGSPIVGLGLWLSQPGFIFASILELAMLVSGIVIYLLHKRKLAAK